MRILEIIPVLDEGGAERFVTDLSNSLAENNEVSLLILYPINNQYASLSKDLQGVKLYSLNKKRGFSFFSMLKLYKLIRKIKPDVVHTHLNSIVYLIFPILFLRKVSYVHTIHNDANVEAGGFINKMIRKIFFRFGLVKPIAISEESNNSFQTVYGFSTEIIYNARPKYITSSDTLTAKKEIDFIRSSSNSKVIVNVARISHQKNQLELIKAVNALNNQGCSIELVIIGPCVDDEIKKDIQAELTSRIHLLGVRENPRDYMVAADAFCLSSIYEGMPITLIEAFSVGAIPICTPVGGIKNMIEHNNNGLLFSGVDKESFITGLSQFVGLSDAQIETIKENSRKSYLKYSMSECCMAYERVMTKSLKQ